MTTNKLLELADWLDGFGQMECRISYENKKYVLHISIQPDRQTEIKETPYMTPLEIREAEENIEASE